MSGTVSGRRPLEESHPAFGAKKQRIVQQLAGASGGEQDRSPKGSVDEEIRPLVDAIAAQDGLVTTSSCAGRVSVFLEGEKTQKDISKDASALPHASVGGKGGGGRWLFVTHQPLGDPAMLDDVSSDYLTHKFGLSSGALACEKGSVSTRLIHFKFEPMILHVLTASIQQAQIVLKAAFHAGFRESGAVNVESDRSNQAMPIVAVRSSGLALDSIIGYASADGPDEAEKMHALVDEGCLRILVSVANQRFAENARRRDIFEQTLLELCCAAASPSHSQSRSPAAEREDRESRRQRKRAEGLRRRDELMAARSSLDGSGIEDHSVALVADEDTALERLDLDKTSLSGQE